MWRSLLRFLPAATALVITSSHAPGQDVLESSTPVPPQSPRVIATVLGGSVASWFRGTTNVPITSADSAVWIPVMPDAGAGWNGFVGADVIVAYESMLIGARVAFERRTSERAESDPQMLVQDPQTFELLTPVTRSLFRADLLSLQIRSGVALLQSDVGRLDVAVGLEQQFVLATRIRRTMETERVVHTLGNFPTEDNGRRVVFYDGSIPNHARSVTAATAALAYGYQITDVWVVAATIEYAHPFTELASGMRVSTIRVAGGVGLVF